MSSVIQFSLDELALHYRASYDKIRSGSGTLLSSRSRAGASLFVYVPPAGVGRCFFPEFDRVWWRSAWRWARGFKHVDKIRTEVLAIKPRKRYPFFCTATARLEAWAALVSAGDPTVDDHYEIVVPSIDAVEQQVEGFIGDWVSTFTAEAFDLSIVDSDCRHLTESRSPLLHLPSPNDTGQSQGLAEEFAAELNALIRAGHPSPRCLPGLIPNINSFLLPGNLGPGERAAWELVIDLRLEWMCQIPSPLHYLFVQDLMSKNQFAREFVREANPETCRGVSLVGLSRCQKLHELGLCLEHQYPVLGREAVPACT